MAALEGERDDAVGRAEIDAKADGRSIAEHEIT
jgi:hypothetical protein